MESEDEDFEDTAGEIFGQKRPPLHQTIAKILKEYPVGQIFKEIIQNADDARATTVKFYLDERKLQTLPKKLVPSVSRNHTDDFTGPALMTFNDAPFKQEDWESIQSIHDSRKATNLHKVGKFGIGFNSVYHLTDLPVIISEDFCGFLEPYEEIWKGESGKGFRLRYLSRSCPDALVPYHNIEGFSKHAASFTNKTIMRFPFRKKGLKKISEFFDTEKLLKLLEVLKSEAKYLLLFLRSVCSIEVIRLTSIGKKTIFKVEINDDDVKQHNDLQRLLVQQVERAFTNDKFSNKIIEKASNFQIKLFNGSQISIHHWMVIHRVGSEDDEVLDLARRLHVLPWVGTAYEIGNLDFNHLQGRIFCFLPLPTEERAPFMVHINGTFAMSSNRKSLNWESEERYDDIDATWNRYLVERCIPKCYTRMISELIKAQVSSDIVYACWPIVSDVEQTPWNGILCPLFENIFSLDEVVYASCEQWVSMNDGIFFPPAIEDNESEDSASLISSFIEDVFMSTDENLVKIQSKFLTAISRYYEDTIKQLTPAVLRTVLKSNDDCYDHLSHKQKLSLLEYCLIDKDYDDLHGISLVPLTDESFGTFHSNYYDEYYVCNSKIRHDLFKEIDSPLIDLLDTYPLLHKSLMSIAKSSKTQLTQLRVEGVVKLLKQSRPQTWSLSQIEKLWKWLQDYDLVQFQNLKIIPVKNLSTHQKLKKNFDLVYVSQYHHPHEDLITGLESFQINFACHSDFPFLNHHQLNRFLYQFEVKDIIDAISPNGIDEVYVTDDEADAILSFLSSSELKYLNVDRTTKISQMRLFPVMNSDSRKSIKKMKIQEKALVQGDGFIFRTDLIPDEAENVIKDELNVARMFTAHVRVINASEYLQEVVFPLIASGRFPKQALPEFMKSVLENLNLLNFYQYRLKQCLSSLPFVSVESGHLKPPSSLFDPECEVLTTLYLREPIFPTGIYTKYLDELRSCGLKGKESLTTENLLTIVEKVGQGYHNLTVKDHYSRVQSIFSFLKKNSDFLSQYVIFIKQNNRRTKDLLKNAIAYYAKKHPLLMIELDRPNNYPPALPWKGAEHHRLTTKFRSRNTLPLITEANVEGKCCPSPLIIGSQVLFIKNLPIEVAKILCCSNNELSNLVVSHFQEVINCRAKIDSDTLEVIAMKTYEFLQSCDPHSYDLSVLSEWVWIDSCLTFVKPEMCAFSSNDAFEMILEPYVCVVSNKMLKYQTLLSRFGVEESISAEQILSTLHGLGGHYRNISETKAWNLVKCITDWAIETGNVSSKFPVPVQNEHSAYPLLCPLEEVFYADFEMLLKMYENEEYKLIHPRFAQLASKLDLRPLSDELKITEDVFQDAGQQESLITRLNNILEEYKDGLAIVKELVQNADDAGATEVNILYDDRQHETDKLFFKEMAASHGPALIIQNNAKFSEDDFSNITKLAGATKKNDSLKIGKFGIGFCSVYHITDVPSFVSGEWLYIFDPTLTHLKGAVKNKNQPGKKVKYMSKFISKSNQLAPYEHLFRFNPSTEYAGTMFRLPFRTGPSLISSKKYDKKLVEQLLQELVEDSGNMLLFLNNVKRITFSCMNNEDSPKLEMIAIKTKQPNSVIDIHISQYHETKTGETTTEHWLVSSHEDHQVDSGNTYVSSVACQLNQINFQTYKVKSDIDGRLFCFLPISGPSIGLPVHIHANFAVMNNRSSIWIDDEWNKHLINTVIPETYCKLLMKLKDMHSDESLERYPFHALWPLSFTLKTQIPWINLLEPVYENILNNSLFYSDVVGDWRCLQDGKVFHHDFRVDKNKTIVEAAHILRLPMLLLPDLYMENIQNLNFKIPILTLIDFLNLFFENIHLFENHLNIRNAVLLHAFEVLADKIEESECTTSDMTEESDMIEENEYITSMMEDSLEMQLENPDLDKLQSILQSNKCVPCGSTQEGSILRYCTDVVDPSSDLSKLFRNEDNRFPVFDFSQNKKLHRILIQLGMLNSTMPWALLLDRAQVTSHLYKSERKKSKELVDVIIEYIGNNISCKKYPIEHSTDEIEALKNTPFLPVLQKPKDYHIEWYGNKTMLCAPSQILHMSCGLEKTSFLVGSQNLIFNKSDYNGCKPISSKVVTFLGIQKSASVDSVLAHYQLVIQSEHKINPPRALGEFMEKTSKFVYKYLEASLVKEASKQVQVNSSEPAAETVSQSEVVVSSQSADVIVNSTTSLGKMLSLLNDKPFVWSGRAFICPCDIALNWTKEGPFLFRIPSALSQHKLLVKEIRINEAFSTKKLIETFKKMAAQFMKKCLPRHFRPIVVDILSCLNKMKVEDFENIEDVILPCNNFIFHSVRDLAFNDTPWIKSKNNFIFVHDGLLRNTANKLGVQSNRSKFISRFENTLTTSSREFGQKEKLTQRIKNILRSYQLDITFMKEFLQNADDAGATKLFVILDKRNHNTKYILSSKWRKLQGPALMVWNDKDFSDEDLEGIQSLGSGSKQDNPDSIGEFGIGFNVVYHITDCPSLLTRKNIFCVFDPCCQYLPGASEEKPGHRYNTNSEFWNNFQDLCDPLLISKPLPGQPKCLKEGSLFRFPLRCEGNKENMIAKTISVKSMEEHLNNWVTDVKESLLFLNHITCFKFLVIDENGFQTRMSYEIAADRKMCRNELAKTEPKVVCYPLSITTTVGNKGPSCIEQWLIQQGIGDTMADFKDQHQEIPDTMDNFKDYQEIPDKSHQLMSHGIAAPLTNTINGKVFCFLPLPKHSGLPVHINGRFVLNDSRRGLWQGHDDDLKTKWNNALMMALSSSYAMFIENIRQHLIKTIQNGDTREMLDRFYSLFPYWLKKNTSVEDRDIFEEVRMMNECKEMAKCFFEKLSSLNHDILASVGHKPMPTIEWNPIITKNQGEHLSRDQVYFCNDDSKKEVLKMIGMKLTCAPDRLRIHLQERDQLVIDAESINKFYTLFHNQIIPKEKLPCHISSTPFETVEKFCKFLKIITRNKDKSKFREFVQSPDGLPVIVTADNKLRRFKEGKVIRNEYYHLFPESKYQFLHKSLVQLDLDESYFITKADYDQITSLMEKDFPNLSQDVVERSVVSYENLQDLWNCFSEKNIFEGSLIFVFSNWALLPSTNYNLYRSSSKIKPIQGNNQQQMKMLLKKLNVPILDTESFTIAIHSHQRQQFCPNISSDFNEVIAILYEVYQHKRGIFHQLNFFEYENLLQYLSQCSFRHNSIVLEQIKSLPLFETINGCRISLNNKTVHLWPENLTKVGYSEWKQEDVVFLDYTGSWTKLCGTDVTFLCIPIDILDVYNDYVFKVFHKLKKKHQREHVRCIKDSIYKDAIHKSETSQDGNSSNFLSTLSKLKFIEHSSGECLAITDLCDPTIELFVIFKNVDSIKLVSNEFQTEDWMEFFKALGLRQTVNKDEYLQLCEEVANHHNIPKASAVLVEFLFRLKSVAENDWYDDETFLKKLKTIKFVAADEMKEYSWIKPPVWKSIEDPTSTVHLMSFYEGLASYDDCADTLWTVKPCLKLPQSNNEVQTHLIEKLGIACTPTAEEIYQNIVNLSKTQFANFELFSKYSAPTCDDNDRDLFEVMINNIEQLSQLDDEAGTWLQKLQSVSCIPVCASSTVKKPVLVNSYQVVVSKTCDLDERLSPYIQFISGSVHRINDPLLKMGMSSVISLKNIQYFLKVAYDKFENVQCIPPHEKSLLNNCIEKLYKLLLDVSSEEELDTLEPPLFLPSSDGSMKPSSQLLYLDCARYKRHVSPSQVQNSGYSLFEIPSNSERISVVDEEKICLKLPARIKPTGFSLACYEAPSLPVNYADGAADGPLYKHFSNLRNILCTDTCNSVERDFTTLLSSEFPNGLDVKKFTKKVIELIQNIQLVEVIDLQVDIGVGSSQVCCVKEDFVFKRKESKLYMYIDNNTMIGPHSRVWKDVSDLLCIEVALAVFNVRRPIYLPFSNLLRSFLQIVSPSDMTSILADQPHWTNQIVRIEVGANITQAWQAKFDFVKNADNVFRPQEYVGFEIDGQLVWSIVLEVGDEACKIALIDDQLIDVCINEIFKVIPKQKPDELGNELMWQMLALLKPEQCLKEARRWLKQAESDYKAMEILFSSANTHNVTSQALFMAFSVLEKALKSAMYGLQGISDYLLHKHDICHMAISVYELTKNTAVECDLRQVAGTMNKYYLDTRYPNRFSIPHTPSSHYSYSPSLRDQTVYQTKEALEKVKGIIEDAATKTQCST